MPATLLTTLLTATPALAVVVGAMLEPILLWPQGAPGETDDKGGEKMQTPPGGREVNSNPVTRLTNITQPTLTVYRPAPEHDSGTAVVVCPGGGYNILAWDLEGTEICHWLNSLGVTGVLLKYRIPPRKEQPRYAAPLQDAQRTLGYVRAHATRWHLDPHRIGILGFSAGGHLSATASTNYEKRSYEPVDDADQTSCRPDFVLLIYPAYLVDKDHHLALELKVTADTPPTFLVQTADDHSFIDSSLFYYGALKNAGVAAEMHLYAKGGHGYGLRPSTLPVTNWPQRAEEWLRGLGLLPAKK